MNGEGAQLRSDESILDEVFDRALVAWGKGASYAAEDALAARPELEREIERALALARQVSIVRPPGLPQVAGYELLSELGRGSSGTVFLARHRALGRLAALKVLVPGAALSIRSRERFLSEARALAKLRHSNVVVLYDVIDAGGAPAYAMEHVEGISLARLLARLRQEPSPSIAHVWRELGANEPLPEGLTLALYFCRMARQLALALAAVHEAGLLHRDVKPSNILLRRDGAPVLSDFGLAREQGAPHRTQTGQFVGTPLYAAPEQLRGAWQRVDARTDVYALGVTLYECLTRRLPYRSASSADVITRIERGLSIPLRKVDPALPRELETIVAKAIEPEAERRYASAQELADDLERLLSLQPIRAKPASLALRAWRTAQRNRRVLLASVATGLAVLAAALGLWWSARQRVAHAAQAHEHVRRAELLLLRREHELRENLAVTALDQAEAQARALLDEVVAEYDRALALRGDDMELALQREAVALGRALDLAEPVPEASAILRRDCPTTARWLTGAIPGGAPPAPALDEIAAASALDRRILGLIGWVAEDAEIVQRAWGPLDRSLAPDALVSAVIGEYYLSLDLLLLAYPRLGHAIERYPAAAFLWLDYGCAALQTGDRAIASLAFARARELGGELTPGMRQWFDPQELEAFEAKARSTVVHQSLLRQIPSQPAHRHRAGRLCERRGDLPGAIAAYMDALRGAPDDPKFSLSLERAVDRWWDGLGARERVGALARALALPDQGRDALGWRLDRLATARPEAPGARPAAFSADSPHARPEQASEASHPVPLRDLSLTLEVVKMDRSKLWAAPQTFKQALAAVCLVSDEQPLRGFLNSLPIARSALRGAIGLGLAVAATSFAHAQAPTNNYSLQFDGTNYVFVPSSAGMTLGATMTIEVWVRPEPGTSGIVMQKWSPAIEDKTLWLDPTSGYAHIYSSCVNYTWGAPVPGGAPGDRWYHVAGVVDSGIQRMFVNGHQIGTLAIGGCDIPDSSSSVYIARHDSGGSMLNGQIAAFRWSNSARYSADFVPQLSWAPDAEDILNLPFEEGVGGTTADVSPLVGVGVLVNNPQWVASGPSTALYQVSPPSGSFVGGNTVTLSGLLLNDPASIVLFDGVPGTVLTTGFDTLTVTVPAGTPGQTADVVVANSFGFATLADSYTYAPKLVTSVSGTASTGGSVTAAVTSHLSVTGIYGIATGPALGGPIPIAPFAHGLLVFPFTIMKQGVLPLSGASPVFPFGISPSLAGVPITLQGIALTLVPLGGAFTNASTFTIAP